MFGRVLEQHITLTFTHRLQLAANALPERRSFVDRAEVRVVVLAPLLVIVPRVVRAHAEAVPHRQRRLVAGDDRARGVLRALRAVFVFEEQQVALARGELEVIAGEHRTPALGRRLTIH